MTTNAITVRARRVLHRVFACMTALLLMLALSLQGGLFRAEAATQQELESQKEDLEAKADALKQQLSQASADLSDEQKNLETKRELVENAKEQLDVINQQLDSLNSQLSDKDAQIAAKEQAIEENEKEAETLKVQLEERLRAVTKQGNLSAVQMLFSTEDYAEYLIKSKMLENIAEQDQDALDALEAELAQIKEDKAALETDKQSISAEKAEVEKLQDEATAKKKEIDALYKSIQSTVNELQDDVDAIKKQQQANDAAIEALDSQIQSIINSQSSSTGKYGDGSMVWPVPTVRNISSGYGTRWGKLHRGIDIANGSIPVYGEKIVAAADGVVIYSNYTSTYGGGYGYYCIVDHGLDSQGRRISTLYAHASKMYARVGDKVTAGETVLALAGDTGNVTGPHLHFEVRVNGTAVDPIKNGYVSVNR